MNAVVLEGPESLRVEERPEPAAGGGDVFVGIKATENPTSLGQLIQARRVPAARPRWYGFAGPGVRLLLE